MKNIECNIIESAESDSDIEEILDAAYLMTIQGYFERAFSLYDRILEKEPKNVRAVNSKAVALQQAGKNDEALVWYDKALKIDPRDANALYNKACTKALQTSL